MDGTSLSFKEINIHSDNCCDDDFISINCSYHNLFPKQSTSIKIFIVKAIDSTSEIG